MTTFLHRFDTSGTGVRLAVKDLIDIVGVPTTAGCRAVARTAQPAAADAACLAGARAAGARIVGQTNLHELALGVTGINPWYGTPVNPLDPARAPGGSSSGSAVAVASGEADVAYGSDTGGSIRIPAACCGIAGLKTTYGRIPLEGVWPLSPSFDTVGPLAGDVAGLVIGMQLLEPGFQPASPKGLRIGRLRVDADPVVDTAVDGALLASGWDVADVPLPLWADASVAAGTLLVHEAWLTDRLLVEADPDGIGADVLARLRSGGDYGETVLAAARATGDAWRAELAAAFQRFDFIATPTLTILPPRLEDADALLTGRCTIPINLAGVPALSLPAPTPAGLPASVQLIGPSGSEADLLAAGSILEEAVSP